MAQRKGGFSLLCLLPYSHTSFVTHYDKTELSPNPCLHMRTAIDVLLHKSSIMVLLGNQNYPFKMTLKGFAALQMTV